MTIIESEKVVIATSGENLFGFLGDFDNLEKIMPQGISNWQSGADEGSFTIKGMADIGLKISEKIPHSRLKMIRTKAPFDLSLDWNITSLSDDSSQLQVILEADLNMMMKMMAETPLKNFINMLADNCRKNFAIA